MYMSQTKKFSVKQCSLVKNTSTASKFTAHIHPFHKKISILKVLLQ